MLHHPLSPLRLHVLTKRLVYVRFELSGPLLWCCGVVDYIQQVCRVAMEEQFQKLHEQLVARGLVSDGDSHPTDSDPDSVNQFFRFQEICQRSTRRYDLRVDTTKEPFATLQRHLQSADGNSDTSSDNNGDASLLQALLPKCLGSRWKLLYMGVVWSQPGSEGTVTIEPVIDDVGSCSYWCS